MCENAMAYRKHLINKANMKQENNELLNFWQMGGKLFTKASPKGSPIQICRGEDLVNL